MRDGRVKDRVRQFSVEFPGMLASAVREAQRQGELDDGIEPEQLAFEIDCHPPYSARCRAGLSLVACRGLCTWGGPNCRRRSGA